MAGGGVTAIVTGAATLTGAGAVTAAKVVAAWGAMVVEGCGLDDIMKAATVATVTMTPSPPIIFAPRRGPGLWACGRDADLAAEAGADACSMLVLPSWCAWK